MSFSNHPLYSTYRHMVSRCHKPDTDSYKYYGARGISVCDRWRNDFWLFVEDVGEKPTPKHTIDRIDNDGNYEPDNVRWATRKEQAHNTRLFISEFCTVDGCERKHTSRGMCKYHYTKWYREQNPEWHARVQKINNNKDPEKNRKKAKEHYWKNVEANRARQVELRKENPDKHREYRKKYYQKNIIKLREKARERPRKKRNNERQQ